jgi:hypothetical protein
MRTDFSRPRGVIYCNHSNKSGVRQTSQAILDLSERGRHPSILPVLTISMHVSHRWSDSRAVEVRKPETIATFE